MNPAFMLATLLLAPAADPIEADVVIRGATIIDGAGKPGVKGDLALKGERLVAVGSFTTNGKAKIIDGEKLIVAPGFIDLHSHSDLSPKRPESNVPPLTEEATRANLNFLMQGVTTVVTGNCGFGPVHVADFFRKLDDGKIGSNVIHLVPHNDLRQQVMGNANRPPTREELSKMKELVGAGMKAGAWGLATGLYYTPGSYADRSEVIELAQVAAAHGGLYASHMRDEGAGLFTSIEETLAIGRQARLPVHISHFKAYGPKAWGKAVDAIAMIEKARGAGQEVTADQYPYTASSTKLAADVIPGNYREGSQKDLIARLDDPELGPKIRQAIARNLKDADDGKNLRIARYPAKPEWQGKDLAAIAQSEKKSPVDVVVEIERHGGAQIVNFSMKEEDVRIIMKQPWVATASDGATMIPSDTVPHPRNYGCFARKVGRYAGEEKVLPLEQAVRSASGLPADILKLPERGYLKPGYFADVVVFDPATYRDTATFDKPHQYATGVRWLFVNGTPVISEGKYAGALAGKALRHQSTESYRDLFNGKDLDGWMVEGPKADKEGNALWSVQDGLIVCLGKGYGFLRHERQFRDFALCVEYRFAPQSKTNPRGNSGLGIRTVAYDPKRTELTRPSYAAYEIQLLDDAGKPANAHGSGSLYRYLAPSANPVKPAPEWNTIEVECVGPRIKITINGQKVVDADQTSIPDTKDKPAAAPAPKDKPLEGYVSLQSHSGRVEFRKVQVREIGK